MTKAKELRLRVWNKCNKHCGYCGNELEYKNMQVDHILPKALSNYNLLHELVTINDFNNLMPSCRSCNHYKRDHNLKQFRSIMLSLHERIEKHYINKVAINFGIITEVKPFDGVFYFEKLTKTNPEIETL